MEYRNRGSEVHWDFWDDDHRKKTQWKTEVRLLRYYRRSETITSTEPWLGIYKTRDRRVRLITVCLLLVRRLSWGNHSRIRRHYPRCNRFRSVVRGRGRSTHPAELNRSMVRQVTSLLSSHKRRWKTSFGLVTVTLTMQRVIFGPFLYIKMSISCKNSI